MNRATLSLRFSARVFPPRSILPRQSRSKTPWARIRFEHMSMRFEMRTETVAMLCRRMPLMTGSLGPKSGRADRPDKIRSMENHAVRKLRVFGFACCFKYFVARNVHFRCVYLFTKPFRKCSRKQPKVAAY
jgi:hypothetical protein